MHSVGRARGWGPEPAAALQKATTCMAPQAGAARRGHKLVVNDEHPTAASGANHHFGVVRAP
jgi:hypothetical protein